MSKQGRTVITGDTKPISVDEVYALQLAEAETLDPETVAELEMSQTVDPDWPTLLDFAYKRMREIEAQLAAANERIAELEALLAAAPNDMQRALEWGMSWEDTALHARAWAALWKRAAKERRADYYEALEDTVRQHCSMNDGTYQHFSMSSYESAFRELTDAGIMRQINRVRWAFVNDKQARGGA